MPKRSGDKAMIGRERKNKILRRKHKRELRQALESSVTGREVPSLKENVQAVFWPSTINIPDRSLPYVEREN
jgi:hypothetical protein